MKWILIIVLAIIGLIALVAIIGACLPKRHVASRSVRFRVPLKNVWDVVVAFGAQQSWREDLIAIERQPDRNGHEVWRETMKNSPPLDFETTELVVGQRVKRRIVTENLPFGGEWVIELAANPAGTTLTVTENGEIYNPVFRFVARFVMGYTATIDGYLLSLARKLGEDVPPQ
ncbi:MAG: SRPBCC family protein [Planctomycetota bacterium]